MATNIAQTTQVRIRRGTTELIAGQVVEGEPFYDLDVQRMGIGGGSQGVIQQWKSQFLENTQPYDGAVSRTIQEKFTDIVSVKDFGAVGDGVTDDTAAFKKAIQYAQEKNASIYVPCQNVSAFYRITEILSITKPIGFFGEGSRRSYLFFENIGSGNFAFEVDGTDFGTFEDLCISGITLRVNGDGDVLKLKNASKSIFSDVVLMGNDDGLFCSGVRCFSNQYNNLVISVGGKAFLFDDHTGGGNHSFYHCLFSGEYGFFIGEDVLTDGLVFTSCNFESCTVKGFVCKGTVYGLSFFGGRHEGDLVGCIDISPASTKAVNGLIIHGIFFSPNDNTVKPIELGSSAGSVYSFSISGCLVRFGGPDIVLLGAGASNGTITANNSLNTSGIISAQRDNVIVFGNKNSLGNLPEYWGIFPKTFTPTMVSSLGVITVNSATGIVSKSMGLIRIDITINFDSDAAVGASNIIFGNFPISNNSSFFGGGNINYNDYTPGLYEGKFVVAPSASQGVWEQRSYDLSSKSGITIAITFTFQV
jgi:hypothetical protein